MSAMESRTRWGAGIGSPRVSPFGIATVFIPAVWAARSPFGESSKTTQAAGSTPRRSAASRNRSGAGFTRSHVVTRADRVKEGHQIVPLEPRVDPRRRAAGCYGKTERQSTRLAEALADARQQGLLAAQPPVLIAHERGEGVPVQRLRQRGAQVLERVEAALRAERVLPASPLSGWRHGGRRWRPRCRTGGSRCR